jgi:acyl carrier protein
MMTTKETVLEILATVLLSENDNLEPEALLEEDLGADSLDRIEIAMAIEEQLLDDDEIDGEIVEGWKTVADVIASAEKMVAKLPAATR